MVQPAGGGRRRRFPFLEQPGAAARHRAWRIPRAAMKATEMRISDLDDHELEVLLMALRYWRAQRRDGMMRRSDPPVTNESVDLLLAKLGYALAMAPPDDRP